MKSNPILNTDFNSRHFWDDPKDTSDDDDDDDEEDDDDGGGGVNVSNIVDEAL